MESESKKRVVWWCDLPAELLAIIAGETPTDTILFRSVCRSWRLSLPPRPPLPDKHILFPLTISFDDGELTPVMANTVYLLRHHRHDSKKVMMLSAQESNPGKILLQHPLTNRNIRGSSGNILDLSEWRVTQQIHTSYTYKDDVPDDLYTRWQRKVVLVPNSTTPTVICRYRQPQNSLWAFRTTVEEGNILSATQLSPFVNRDIEDFVSFNGWIYLAEALSRPDDDESVDSYDILMFDYKTSQQFGIACGNLRGYLMMACPLEVRFVVSGDLYIVLESMYFTEEEGDLPFADHSAKDDNYFLHECRVYRLVRDDMNVPTCCKWERVEDIGDRVFFITKNCSFSVSPRDLPPPWKGNYVVVTFLDCRVFDLGARQWKRNHDHQLLFDLFSPSWTNQRCKQVTQQQSVNKCSSVDN